MIAYYAKQMEEALEKAEMKAARGDPVGAIYQVTDAVRAVMACIKELQEKADVT